MSFVAATADRVERHTPIAVRRRIAEGTAARLAAIGEDRAAISARLAELDREWDIERAIQANAGTLAFTGTVLGLAVHRCFLVLPLAVTAFLVQHAVQGWCPPVPILRRLGFRTLGEIHAERDELRHRMELQPV